MSYLPLAMLTRVTPWRRWLSKTNRQIPDRQPTSSWKIFKISKGKRHRNTVCPLPLRTPRSFRKNMTNVSETATPVVEVSEMPASGQAAVDGENTASRQRGSGRKLRTPFRRRRGDAAAQQSGQQIPEGGEQGVAGEE